MGEAPWVVTDSGEVIRIDLSALARGSARRSCDVPRMIKLKGVTCDTLNRFLYMIRSRRSVNADFC